MSFVAQQCGSTKEDYIGFRVNTPDREIAALLCRELATNSLADLSEAFGLGHPDSSANLIKRAKIKLDGCQQSRKRYNKLKSEIAKIEYQV